jgi:hypothetical protein
MTVRSSSKIVHFTNPFELDGMEGPHPAGSFLVQTDEELLDGLSFVAYRRIATLIHLTRDGDGMTEVLSIDPKDLDAALAEDLSRTRSR